MFYNPGHMPGLDCFSGGRIIQKKVIPQTPFLILLYRFHPCNWRMAMRIVPIFTQSSFIINL